MYRSIYLVYIVQVISAIFKKKLAVSICIYTYLYVNTLTAVD